MSQATNLKVQAASALGFAGNTNPTTGLTLLGATPPDDGPVGSAFLSASGLNDARVLVLDGFSTASGLFGGSGGDFTIEGKGWDTGIFMRAASNDDVIRNGAASPNSVNPVFDPGSYGYPSWVKQAYGGGYTAWPSPAVAVPARGQNITLRDFAINGNRDANSTTGDPRGLAMLTSPGAATNRWWCGIRLDNVDGVFLENLKVSNIGSFIFRLSNVSRVYVRGLWLSSAGLTYGNGDGLHFDGNSKQIHIADSHFETNDDAIAGNACEGYPGPITDFVVSNCTFLLVRTAGRFYYSGELVGTAAQTGSVSGVRYSNCSGSASSYVFVFGVEIVYPRAANYDRITDWAATNCHFVAPALAYIVDNVGTLSFDGIIWEGSTVASQFGGFLTLAYNGATCTSLAVSNCAIRRTAANSSATGLLDCMSNIQGAPTNGAHVIQKLTISGFSVQDDAGLALSNIPYLLNLNSVTVINSLVINAVDTSKFGALCNPAYIANVQLISGPGVLATGFQIPDANMANNTPYISATAPNVGKAVIKLAGVVTAL